jgi:two-component system, LytTR family, response regulator
MKLLDALVVDDELVSGESLRSLLHQYCDNVKVVAICQTVDEALHYIMQNGHPNVVFLDVNMKGETGFDLLNRLQHRDFDVVFTTAHAEFAIRAFKFSAIDYLLKPIDIVDLKEAVIKVRQKQTDKQLRTYEDLLFNLSQQESRNFRLTLSTTQGLIFIKPYEILSCVADGNYTVFHLVDGRKVMVSQTLKEYDSILTPLGFFRVHHSALVNTEAIQQYNRGDGGQVVLKNGQILDVSRRKKDELLRLLQRGI